MIDGLILGFIMFAFVWLLWVEIPNQEIRRKMELLDKLKPLILLMETNCNKEEIEKFKHAILEVLGEKRGDSK